MLFFRLPFPRQSLSFGNLIPLHSFDDHVAVINRALISLSRREVEPHVRQYVVMRYTSTSVVHPADAGAKVCASGNALERRQVRMFELTQGRLVTSASGGVEGLPVAQANVRHFGFDKQ